MSRHALSLPPECHQLLIRPWVDPLVDQLGHDPRSVYVERFWLGILGPSATWFLRYVAESLDGSADGFDLDLATCAASLGLGSFRGRAMPFLRTVTRCCQFRTARLAGETTLEVRRKLPPLTARQVGRLPAPLQREHGQWAGRTASGTPGHPRALADQARRLALSLVELGEGPVSVEQQLERWRFPLAMVREATLWAFDRRGTVARGHA